MKRLDAAFNSKAVPNVLILSTTRQLYEYFRCEYSSLREWIWSLTEVSRTWLTKSDCLNAQQLWDWWCEYYWKVSQEKNIFYFDQNASSGYEMKLKKSSHLKEEVWDWYVYRWRLFSWLEMRRDFEAVLSRGGHRKLVRVSPSLRWGY